jgi:selenocysteine lyase/cysteine desulfurase
MSLLPVVAQDLRVPLVTGAQVLYVNLDHAASAPCLAAVKAAVDAVLPWSASVHRGAGFASTVCSELFAGARAEIAAFVGARPDDTLVFTRHTTDALNLLARALPEDTVVITFAGEHHANLLPWRAHRQEILWHPRELAAALSRHVGPRLVAVTGASNVTGERWPLAEIVATAHAHGARVVVDGAQLVAHRRIDLGDLGADYLVFSGHKLYAPFGAGVLVGRADWLDEAEPYLAGGGAVAEVSPLTATYREGAARHEAGTPNLIGAVALAAACRALADVGFAAIEAHERRLLTRLVDGLERLGLRPLAFLGGERVGLVSFVPSLPPARFAAALAAEHGIGVRDGLFCAHPLLARLGGPAVRASVGVDTSLADVEAFLAASESLLRHGPRWAYREEGGRFVPDPDPRPRPSLGLDYSRVIGGGCGGRERSMNSRTDGRAQLARA